MANIRFRLAKPSDAKQIAYVHLHIRDKYDQGFFAQVNYSFLKQTLNEIRSDKACCSSNENGLALKIYIILYHELITLKYVTSINLLNHIIEA